MTPDRIVIRLPLRLGSRFRNASWTVIWTRPRDSAFFTFDAEAQAWCDGNTRLARAWRGSLGLTSPAVHASFVVEPVNGGAWRSFTDMPPVIDVSTFWWVSALFLESLTDHPEWEAALQGLRPPLAQTITTPPPVVFG